MGTTIEGLGDRSVGQVQAEVAQGAKFVLFPYCVSLLVVTLRRSSAVHYVGPGESAVGKAVPYILLSLALGWWGFPFGLVFTPICVIQNLAGGKDVTQEVMAALGPGGPVADSPYDPSMATVQQAPELPPKGSAAPPSGWVG